MDFDKTYTAKEIASWIDAECLGPESLPLSGLNEIHKVRPGDIMFVDVEKYFQKALRSPATGIILNRRIEAPEGKVLFLVDNPFRAYETLARRFRVFEAQKSSIHPTARIHPSVTLEPGVIIGRNVQIGKCSLIQANCFIGNDTKIGEDVWIQPNTTIGSEAFYFKKQGAEYEMWTSVGQVIIEDQVTIGANCAIDKGVSGDTRIGKGSKIDNHVHLGHGVIIGKNCLLAGQVGIGGETVVGDRVTMYGQVGIINSLHIGDDVVILGQSGVTRNLRAGTTYYGTPAIENRQRLRELAALRKLGRG